MPAESKIKVDKQDVRYAVGGRAHCADCRHFVREAGTLCRVVAGPVAPVMWCELYSPRAAE